MNARPPSPILSLSAALLVALPLAVGAAGSLSAQVQPVGRELRLNAPEDFKETAPLAFYDADGLVTVIWENDQLGIRGRRFSAAGRPQGPNLHLVDNQRLPSIPGVGPIVYRSQPAAVALPGGGFFLFWTEEEATYHVQVFQEWRDVHDRNVFGRRFDSAGRPAGEAFRVNGPSPGFQTRPAVALSPRVGMLVSWESDDQRPGVGRGDGVFARLFDLDGSPLSDEVRVNTRSGATALKPAVAANGEGQFLVAWEGCCADGDEDGVFAAFIDSRGHRGGEDFQVNSSTWGPQRRPAVAADPWSNFLVAWQGRFEEPLHSRIFGQVVGRDGTFLGPELQLSEGVGIAQASPALVPTPRGGFLVAWIDWDGTFPVGLYGTEIDALGNRLGDEIAISGAQVNAQYRFGAAGDGSGRILLTWEGFQGRVLGITGRRLTAGQETNRTLGLSAQ
jgi:hypothetical protein